MKVIDCPHCHRRVGLASGSLCPACGEDTADLTGVDRDRAVIWVTEAQPLPDLCCECGSPTHRRIRVTGHAGERVVVYTEMSPGDILLSILGRLLVPFFSVYFFIRSSLHPGSTIRHRVSKVTIRLPCCRDCRPVAAPIAVDAARKSLKLGVHRTLASALKADSDAHARR